MYILTDYNKWRLNGQSQEKLQHFITCIVAVGLNRKPRTDFNIFSQKKFKFITIHMAKQNKKT